MAQTDFIAAVRWPGRLLELKAFGLTLCYEALKLGLVHGSIVLAYIHSHLAPFRHRSFEMLSWHLKCCARRLSKSLFEAERRAVVLLPMLAFL